MYVLPNMWTVSEVERSLYAFGQRIIFCGFCLSTLAHRFFTWTLRMFPLILAACKLYELLPILSFVAPIFELFSRTMTCSPSLDINCQFSDLRVCTLPSLLLFYFLFNVLEYRTKTIEIVQIHTDFTGWVVVTQCNYHADTFHYVMI